MIRNLVSVLRMRGKPVGINLAITPKGHILVQADSLGRVLTGYGIEEIPTETLTEQSEGAISYLHTWNGRETVALTMKGAERYIRRCEPGKDTDRIKKFIKNIEFDMCMRAAKEAKPKPVKPKENAHDHTHVSFVLSSIANIDDAVLPPDQPIRIDLLDLWYVAMKIKRLSSSKTMYHRFTSHFREIMSERIGLKRGSQICRFTRAMLIQALKDHNLYSPDTCITPEGLETFFANSSRSA